MATAVAPRGIGAMAPPEAQKLVEDFIPDIIEEIRKDSEGRTVTNQYARGKLLGKGGFAKCFLGLLIPSKAPYALKIVAKSTLAKARAKQKLQSEIKIHRTLRHVNVVRFERYFEDTTNVYMLLELCTNNSMSDLLKRRKRLTDIETRYYLVQLIGSLKYLHDNNVIHRDLKLGNLFIDSQMRIKVGDFGLATKVIDRNERKKTVCGTPNYIAPEILEGKNGHSFEVDVWSTGVILYTLLVGKPPFESKDVKSTYKRILANSFSFPDHISVCEHAKNLIRHVLQTKPELRPSLDGMLQHTYFSRASAFTPTILPESALRDPPQYSQAQMESQMQLHEPKKMAGYPAPEIHLNDENDPGAMNRQPYQHHNQAVQAQLAKPKSSFLPDQPQGRPRTAPPAASAAPAPAAPTGAAHHPSQEYHRYKSGDPPTRPLTAGPATSLTSSSSATVLPGVSARSGQSGQTDPTMRATVLSAPAPQQPRRESSRPSTAAPTTTTTTSSGPDKRTSGGKFDIYQDGKIAPAPAPKPAASGSSGSSGSAAALRDASASGASGNRANIQPREPVAATATFKTAATYRAPPAGHYDRPGTTGAPVPASTGSTGTTANGTASSSSHLHGLQRGIDQLQAGLEVVQLDDAAHEASSSRRTLHASSRLTGRPEGRVEGRVESAAPPRRATEAWSEEDHRVLHHFAAPLPAKRSGSQRGALDQALAPLQQPTTVDTSEPMQLGTPPEQTTSKASNGPHPGEYKALGTLETMHEVLASRGLDDLPMDAPDSTHQRQAQLTYKSSSGPNGTSPLASPLHHKATVWVVRYVDYTSKYGLGFLLNTGSAGVYFNDSTKIVLSPDGSIFQYVERRRRDPQGCPSGSGSGSEHTIQTHLVSYYPSELQKKVTLLRHFRNYLVDQQREGASRAEDGSAAGGAHGMETIAMASLDGTNSGASSSVPFGASSIALKATDAASMGCMAAPFAGDSEMPFLKKWVRTRHAILFRLSNRTVQVLFFDRSEVLLSSEARMVTYVNKQGVRSEHSLEEVLQTGRTDIAKRLKYAKDIMYRLISTQAR